MKCKVCGRGAESELCELHKEAYENLRKKYEDWKKSTNISWIEYLKEIQKNLYAGIWVKEVVQYLLLSSNSSQ